ncbi:MAG: hypothetical protein IPL49_04725 [Saprospirales bacterium]|nr:hypothetical protein [Saprospirales bacterium]MBK8490215.1 hypothetical protein [Saprospirales bacterium]
MKRSFLYQLLFGCLILCSIVSYVYLQAQQDEFQISSQETTSTEIEEKQEVILPDLALVKKLIDVTKTLSSLAPH